MKRVFAIDVLQCDRCGGVMRLIAAIHSPEATRKILDCLGLPSRAPPMALASANPPFRSINSKNRKTLQVGHVCAFLCISCLFPVRARPCFLRPPRLFPPCAGLIAPRRLPEHPFLEISAALEPRSPPAYSGYPLPFVGDEACYEHQRNEQR